MGTSPSSTRGSTTSRTRSTARSSRSRRWPTSSARPSTTCWPTIRQGLPSIVNKTNYEPKRTTHPPLPHRGRQEGEEEVFQNNTNKNKYQMYLNLYIFVNKRLCINLFSG